MLKQPNCARLWLSGTGIDDLWSIAVKEDTRDGYFGLDIENKRRFDVCKFVEVLATSI